MPFPLPYSQLRLFVPLLLVCLQVLCFHLHYVIKKGKSGFGAVKGKATKAEGKLNKE